MTSKKKFNILKVKDPTDNIYTEIDTIFDIPFKLAIIGKSQISLGKTSLILNLLLRDMYYKNHFDGENIFIVTENPADNKLKILKEEKDIPDMNFFSYDEDQIEALYTILQDEFMKEEVKQNRLIIFDDVAFTSGLKEQNKTTVLSKIVMNGRHINLSSLFTSQKYTLIGTNIRTQLTGAMIGGLSTKELNVLEEDLNFLEDKKAFIKMMRDNTKGRDFVVVNFTNPLSGRYLDKNFEPLLENVL